MAKMENRKAKARKLQWIVRANDDRNGRARVGGQAKCADQDKHCSLYEKAKQSERQRKRLI